MSDASIQEEPLSDLDKDPLNENAGEKSTNSKSSRDDLIFENLIWVISRGMLAGIVLFGTLILEKPIKEILRGNLIADIEASERELTVNRYRLLNDLQSAANRFETHFRGFVEEARTQKVSRESHQQFLNQISLIASQFEEQFGRRDRSYSSRLETAAFSLISASRNAVGDASAYLESPSKDRLALLKVHEKIIKK
mgnify:CR=1 FL=1